jgi:hypothetical protein
MQLKLNGKELALVKNDANKYGIEQLKDLAADIAGIWKNIHSRLEDKKLSWLEGIMTGMELINVGKETVAELADLRFELMDLTKSEINELVAHVAKVSGLEDVKAWVFVEDILLETISIVFSVVTIYQHSKEVFKK